MITHAALETLRTVLFASLVLCPVVVALIASAIAALFPFSAVEASEIADSLDVERALASATHEARAIRAYRARYAAPALAIALLLTASTSHADPTVRANVVRAPSAPALVCSVRPLVQGSGSVRTCEVVHHAISEGSK